MAPDPLSLGAMEASCVRISMAEVVASTSSTVARVGRVGNILQAGTGTGDLWGGAQEYIYIGHTCHMLVQCHHTLLERSNKLGKCTAHLLSWHLIAGYYKGQK